MEQIKYLHAADFHLGSPFAGICSEPDDLLARRMPKAAFDALDRLVELGEKERPDFILLAGDLYDQEDKSIRAQTQLHAACSKLHELGIPVLMVHGNHDPLESAFKSLKWPAGTTIFGPSPSTRIIERNGKPLAVVHGASFSTSSAPDICALFQKMPGYDCFQAGLLHCNVDSAIANDSFIPLELDDLLKTGLDAWALGHAHKQNILCRSPFIAYAGSPQGLNPNETGARGCLVVTASNSGGNWHCEAETRNLARIIWEDAFLEVSAGDSLADMETKFKNCLKATLDRIEHDQHAIVNLHIRGQSDLSDNPASRETFNLMAQKCRSGMERAQSIFINSISLETERPHNAFNSNRNDLLGEISGIIDNMTADPVALETFAKQRLLQPGADSRLASIISLPTDENLLRLLKNAQRICLTTLESK